MKLTSEQLVYLKDETYLPIQYHGIIAKQPNFEGNGVHSISELEKICNEYKEYAHQQQVIKQNCMNHIIELKFGIVFIKQQ